MKTLAFYPVVTSLVNLEYGKIYSTVNYGMFKTLLNNRGKAQSFTEKKVLEFLNKILNDKFFMGTIHVLLNLNGLVVDGNNKLEALRRAGLPVNFIILNEPLFNIPNHSEILNNVSEYNSVTSKWSGLDSFNSAFEMGEKCAMAIAKIRLEMTSFYPELKNTLNETRIWHFATNFAKGYKNQALPRQDYCNDVLADFINSKSFHSEMTYLCKILALIAKDAPQLRSWDVITSIAKGHSDFTYKTLYKSVLKIGFKGMENYRKAAIDTKVRLIFVDYTKNNGYI